MGEVTCTHFSLVTQWFLGLPAAFSPLISCPSPSAVCAIQALAVAHLNSLDECNVEQTALALVRVQDACRLIRWRGFVETPHMCAHTHVHTCMWKADSITRRCFGLRVVGGSRNALEKGFNWPGAVYRSPLPSQAIILVLVPNRF